MVTPASASHQLTLGKNGGGHCYQSRSRGTYTRKVSQEISGPIAQPAMGTDLFRLRTGDVIRLIRSNLHVPRRGSIKITPFCTKYELIRSE